MLLSVAYAETDPAVGIWYLMFDFQEYPELKDFSEGNDITFSAIFFLENGDIVEIDTPIAGNVIGESVKTNGHWEKTNDGYQMRLLGFGECTFNVDRDEMIINIPDTAYSMKFRRIVTFNPYKDYIY